MEAESYIHWDVSPVIVQAGPFVLRWYGLLFAAGFIAGYVVVRGMFRREGRAEEELDALLLYVVAGTIVGARLGHCLFYDPAFYLAHPLEILKVWKGGLASHGGAVGVLLALYLHTRGRPGRPYLWLLDRIVVPAALAGSFIRLGNLFNSEIVGTPTDVPWAFVFERVDSLPRHPAQLYESIGYLAVFLLLRAVYRRRGADTPRGLLLGLFLVAVFSYRFLVEFVKAEQAAFGEVLALSMGQLLSIPFILAGVVLLAWARPGATGR